MYIIRFFFASLLLLLLSACSLKQTLQPSEPEELRGKDFQINYVAKSDLDLVFDYQVKTSRRLMRELMLKLYLRNPAYWRNSGARSAEERVSKVFDAEEQDLMPLLNNTRSSESIRLAFDDAFQGDRVLAFVFGLKSMLSSAYGNKQSFYLLDQLDPQKLYNAARNIEVAVWMLSNKQDGDGRLYLLSNAVDGPVKNLSFERLFGKLIMVQDVSAQIVADSTKRTIKNVIQGVARFVFLPI